MVEDLQDEWKPSDAVFTLAETLGWDNDHRRSKVHVCLADRRLTHLLVVLQDGGTFQVSVALGAVPPAADAVASVDALEAICDELMRYVDERDVTVATATVREDGVAADVNFVEGPGCTIWLQRPAYGLTGGEGDLRAGEVRYPPPPDCPTCGEEMIPVIRGYPGADVGAAADRGEVVMWGCVVDPDDPCFVCPNCGAQI